MSTPTERVAEFLRQWARGRDKSDVIYGVHFDIDADMVDLTASDLKRILEENAAVQSVIDRFSKESTDWHNIAMDTLSELAQVKTERDYWRGNAEDYASMLAATRVTTDDATVECTCDHYTWHEASCKCCNRKWGLVTHDGVRVDKAIHPRSGQ